MWLRPHEQLRTAEWEARSRPSEASPQGCLEVVSPERLSDQVEGEVTWRIKLRWRLIRQARVWSGTTSYTYDGADNLLKKTDGRNVQITYQYDLINRLSTKLYNGAVFSTVSRDDVKRQTTITSPNSNTTYAFDPMGRATASTQSIAGNNYSFTYQYNAAGLLTTETYPSGRSVATGYDFGGRAAWLQGSAGRVTTNYIGNPNDQNTWVHYWPHGAIYYYIRGNNVWHAASFNRSLQQTESYEANNNDQGQIYFVSCPSWGDNSDNKVYEICPHTSAGQNNGTLKGYDEWHVGLHFNQTFTYDGMNRLMNVTNTGGYTRNFGYDAFGNMSANAATGINPSALTPNSSDGSNPFFANNQLKSGLYDGAGNQTLIGSLKIAYDAENHQTSVQDGSYSPYLYAYDGNGQRLLKTTPSNGRTIYVYDALGQLAAEYSDNGPTPAPCKTCYLGVDHLGSTRIVIDQNAQPVARHDYLPFGEEILANTAGRSGGSGFALWLLSIRSSPARNAMARLSWITLTCGISVPPSDDSPAPIRLMPVLIRRTPEVGTGIAMR